MKEGKREGKENVKTREERSTQTQKGLRDPTPTHYRNEKSLLSLGRSDCVQEVQVGFCRTRFPPSCPSGVPEVPNSLILSRDLVVTGHGTVTVKRFKTGGGTFDSVAVYGWGARLRFFPLSDAERSLIEFFACNRQEGKKGRRES